MASKIDFWTLRHWPKPRSCRFKEHSHQDFGPFSRELPYFCVNRAFDRELPYFGSGDPKLPSSQLMGGQNIGAVGLNSLATMILGLFAERSHKFASSDGNPLCGCSFSVSESRKCLSGCCFSASESRKCLSGCCDEQGQVTRNYRALG